MMKSFIVGGLFIMLCLFEYTQCVQLKSDMNRLGSSVTEINQQVESLKEGESDSLGMNLLVTRIFARLVSMLVLPGLIIFFVLWTFFSKKSTIKESNLQLIEVVNKILS